MKREVSKIRGVIPKWRPKPSAYETIEGEIRANHAAAQEARTLYLRFQRTGLVPGPFAVASYPARGPGRHRRKEEVRINNENGREHGCHTCGTKNPGTRSGNFVHDHQYPTAIIGIGHNSRRKPQRIYPQCLKCSARQGQLVRWLLEKPLDRALKRIRDLDLGRQE